MIIAVAANAEFSPTAAVVGAVLLILNAFFVAAEIALLAARRTRIEAAAEAGAPGARQALRSLRELSITFSGAQLGITACSLGIGLVAEPAVAALVADVLGGTQLPSGVVPVIAVVIALSLTVFLHMVLGEMIPKNLALARAESVSLMLARPFSWFVAALRPFILVMNGVANQLVRWAGVEPVDEHGLSHSSDELAVALLRSQETGTITEEDARLMRAALRLEAITAGHAMTPRIDVQALPEDATFERVAELAARTGWSRVPVYRGDIDHVVGWVHAKDALRFDPAERRTTTIGSSCRPIPGIPESQDLEAVLQDMLEAHTHVVLVDDEYGGTAGLLTLEDVLEELVGEIADEFDVATTCLERTADSWVVPGTTRRDEVEELTAVTLAGGSSETVSGWLTERLGRLPEAGDRIRSAGAELVVLNLDGRRAGDVAIRLDEPARSSVSNGAEQDAIRA